LLRADAAPAAVVVAEPDIFCSSGDPAEVGFHKRLAEKTKNVPLLNESRLPDLVVHDDLKKVVTKLLKKEKDLARTSSDDSAAAQSQKEHTLYACDFEYEHTQVRYV
jgi:hypothetical protein